LDDLLNGCLNHLTVTGKRGSFKVNDTDKKGNTLLHKAVMGKRITLLERLLKLGASRRRKNAAGETAFFTAAKLGHYRMALILRQNGSSLITRNGSKQSILHAVLDQEVIDDRTFNFLKWIIRESPGLLHTRDDQKKTPLHVASERNHQQVVDLILEHLPGSQDKKEQYLWKKTSSGQTAQQIAKNNFYYSLEVKLRTYAKEKLGSGRRESLVVESFSTF